MNKTVSVIAVLAVLLAASLGVVNATVFHIGTLTGNVNVVSNTALSTEDAAGLGEACAGFYVYGASSGNTIQKAGVLPLAGTNHQNFVGTNDSKRYLGVDIDWGSVACEWGDSAPYNTTYSGATVDLNVTVGHWYVKDFLGFGYPNIASSQGPNTVYVVFKVESALSLPSGSSAIIHIYSGSTEVGTLNLLSSTSTTTAIPLNKGDGLQFDLEVSSTGAATGSFTVKYYVSTTGESPR